MGEKNAKSCGKTKTKVKKKLHHEWKRDRKHVVSVKMAPKHPPPAPLNKWKRNEIVSTWVFLNVYIHFLFHFFLTLALVPLLPETPGTKKKNMMLIIEEHVILNSGVRIHYFLAYNILCYTPAIGISEINFRIISFCYVCVSLMIPCKMLLGWHKLMFST